jgi:hypothetical protein
LYKVWLYPIHLYAEHMARLHADSWRRTYRGLFTDAFLNNGADSNQTRVWHARLADDRDDQFVYVAIDGEGT